MLINPMNAFYVLARRALNPFQSLPPSQMLDTFYKNKAAPARTPPTILTPAVTWAAAPPVKVLGLVVMVLLALVGWRAVPVMMTVLVMEFGGGAGPVRVVVYREVGSETGLVQTARVHLVVVIVGLLEVEEVVVVLLVGAAPQPDSPG